MSKGPEDKQQLAFRAALDKLLQDPTNKVCSECRAAGPRWASPKLGVFMCMKCSGIHRSLGTHISFVRSVTLDKWKEAEVEDMHPGNSRANAIYEATLPANFARPSSDQIALTTFIRNKYVHLRYVDPNFDPKNPRAFQPPPRQEQPAPPAVEQPKLVAPPVQQQNVSPVRKPQPVVRTPVVLTPNIFDEPDIVPLPAPVAQQPPPGTNLVSLFQVDATPAPLASQQDVAKNNILNLLSQAPPQPQVNYMGFGFPQTSPQAFVPFPVSGQQMHQGAFFPPQENWGPYPTSVDNDLELLNKIQTMAQEKRAGTGISEIYF